MPKWAIKTIYDSKLDAPLPYCTHAHSHHASHINVFYALVASLFHEEEPVTFNEAHRSENWMATMQLVIKNDT